MPKRSDPEVQMSIYSEKKSVTREKRTGSINSFDDSLSTLKDILLGSNVKQRIRTYSQGSCDEITLALSVLLSIRDAVTVIHGAIGCAASSGAYAGEGAVWYCTQLNESDTILGGDEKLRQTVLRAYEENHPQAVFIVSTPVVSINNDDVNSVILELEDEINIPVVSVYTDGFKSKIAANGYDITSHCLLKHIIPEDIKDGDDSLNIVSFSESRADLISILGLLRKLDIKFRLIPRFSSVNDIRDASRAKASVVLNRDDGEYLAEGLFEKFGVPYLRTPSPVGIGDTKRFLRKIGEAFGKSDQVEELIKSEESRLNELKVKSSLSNKSFYLDLPLGYIPGAVETIESIGGKVSGIAVPSVDPKSCVELDRLPSSLNGIPAFAGYGQPFEKANILSKINADYYIARDCDPAFASAYGSIPIPIGHSSILGFDGVRTLYKAAGRNGIAIAGKEKYKPGWLKRSSNWYVKMEEK